MSKYHDQALNIITTLDDNYDKFIGVDGAPFRTKEYEAFHIQLIEKELCETAQDTIVEIIESVIGHKFHANNGDCSICDVVKKIKEMAEKL